jgi:hypothetical protein
LPLLAEEDEPHYAAEKKDDARIEERDRLDRWLELAAQKEQAQQRREHDGDEEAEHPGRKKGADHIDGGRAPTASAQETDPTNTDRKR